MRVSVWCVLCLRVSEGTYRGFQDEDFGMQERMIRFGHTYGEFSNEWKRGREISF